MSKMKRIISQKDLPGYTLMKQVLINLDLNNKDYIWLISDIEAYPSNKELEKEIRNFCTDKMLAAIQIKDKIEK